MMKTPQTRNGFTLVETMVAISLLAIALIGPYVAVQNAVQSSYVARDQLVASQLAQEGVEYIRWIRDNNYLNSRSFMDALSTYACYGANPNNYCTMDPTQGDIHSVPGAMSAISATTSAGFLYISSGGLYNQQDLGTPSKFKRLVRVYTISANEVKVVVQVLWSTGPRSYSVMVVDNLQDWI